MDRAHSRAQHCRVRGTLRRPPLSGHDDLPDYDERSDNSRCCPLPRAPGHTCARARRPHRVRRTTTISSRRCSIQRLQVRSCHAPRSGRDANLAPVCLSAVGAVCSVRVACFWKTSSDPCSASAPCLPVRDANRIVASVAGVLVGGLLTTSLPIVSHYAAAGRFEEMKEALLQAIRFVALVAVPVGLLLIFAGEPMVAMAFERGRFTGTDTSRLALLVALLAPYILFSRVVGVTELAFYATLDMRTPLWAIPVFLISYLALCLLLLPSLGVFAFAIATSLAAMVTALLMIRLVEARFGSLPWADSREFGRRLSIVTATCVVGFLVGSVANSLAVNSGPVATPVRFLIVSIPGLTAFVASAVLVRLVNWQHILHRVRQRRPPITVADTSA